jgi:hypothetical protein
LTGRGWRDLSARMSERKVQPEASFAAAAISGKEAEPWRVGIVGWFNLLALQLDDINACGVRLFESDPRSSRIVKCLIVQTL